MTEPTLEQIEDWYYDCPARTLYHTVDWLARKAFAAGAEAMREKMQDELAAAKELNKKLQALVEGNIDALEGRTKS